LVYKEKKGPRFAERAEKTTIGGVAGILEYPEEKRKGGGKKANQTGVSP